MSRPQNPWLLAVLELYEANPDARMTVAQLQAVLGEPASGREAYKIMRKAESAGLFVSSGGWNSRVYMRTKAPPAGESALYGRNAPRYPSIWAAAEGRSV